MFSNIFLDETFVLKTINFNGLQFHTPQSLFDYLDYVYSNTEIDKTGLKIDSSTFYYEYRASATPAFKIPDKYLGLNIKEYLFLTFQTDKIKDINQKIIDNKQIQAVIKPSIIGFLNSADSSMLDYYSMIDKHKDLFGEAFVNEFSKNFVCYLPEKDFVKIDKKVYSALFDKYWENAQKVCLKTYENPMIVATFRGALKIMEYLVKEKNAKAVYSLDDGDYAEETYKEAFKFIKYEELAPIYKFSHARTLDKLMELGLVPNLKEAIEVRPRDFFETFINRVDKRKAPIEEILILLSQYNFDYLAPFKFKEQEVDFLEGFIKPVFPEQYIDIKAIVEAIIDKKALENGINLKSDEPSEARATIKL